MKIHREGFKVLAVLVLLLFVICLVLHFFTKLWVFYSFTALSIIFIGFVTLFFRSPSRQIPPGKDIVVSPADGTVIYIEEVFENEYFKKQMLKVSVFMSVWNVHLNRVPVSGTVVYQKYNPGKYLMAYHEKASELNESNTVVIEDESGRKVMTRQIAGIVARRVCSYTTSGQKVRQGDELGFIRFGSRVDLFLPLETKLKIGINEKVFGKSSVIAELD